MTIHPARHTATVFFAVLLLGGCTATPIEIPGTDDAASQSSPDAGDKGRPDSAPADASVPMPDATVKLDAPIPGTPDSAAAPDSASWRDGGAIGILDGGSADGSPDAGDGGTMTEGGIPDGAIPDGAMDDGSATEGGVTDAPPAVDAGDLDASSAQGDA